MILGACNPPFTYQALQAEQEVDLLLPRNVAVHEKQGKTTVAAFAPMTIAQFSVDKELGRTAEDVENELRKFLQSR